MKKERKNIPDWARQERENDLRWIRDNLESFWSMASEAFTEQGRGAIFIDTTNRLPGKGHLYGYFDLEFIAQEGDDDIKRIVNEYDPEKEVIIVLVKPGHRSSTYRVKPLKL